MALTTNSVAPPDSLRPTISVDSAHPAIVDFAKRTAGQGTDVDKAVRLYLAVRDGWRYSPWGVRFDRDWWRASRVLASDRGHCIDKALLLAAAARAVGIGARLHFADVQNHLGTERLEQRLGSGRLVFHGYTEMWLGGRFVAATPAFNRELCERLGVEPLGWNGREDSVFQRYGRGDGFMEYLLDRGTHLDVPFDTMFAAWEEHYGLTPATNWVELD